MSSKLKYNIVRLYSFFRGKKVVNRMLWWHKQIRTYVLSLIHPYKYDMVRYEGTFLSNTSDSNDISTTLPVPKIIYVFWTGENEMSKNRKRCLDSIISTSGVKVQLITPQNLKEYILPDHPLHPAYEYLSYVHRADYLRCYFMNYYGGGYVDIKMIRTSWNKSFDRFNCTNAYLVGYPEEKFDGAAWFEQKNANLKYDLFVYWRLLVGNGGYICRPRTKFTEEWLFEIHRRLDEYLPLLRKNPSNEDPYLNVGTDYPIRWTEICGSVFHPLCLKYNTHLLRDKALFPIISAYR